MEVPCYLKTKTDKFKGAHWAVLNGNEIFCLRNARKSTEVE